VPEGSSMVAVVKQRARVGRILFGGAALGTTGFFAGLAVAPLAAEELTGTVRWSGLPGATGVVGTAVGAAIVGGLLRRLGRRSGLTVGYVLGIAGAALAVAALQAGSFALLLLGSGLFGMGNAANQLTRYVVADLHDRHHRGRALGWIVWAGTIGGVVGPSLLAPTGRLAEAAGRPELAGPYAVGVAAMVLVVIAYQVLLRPDPATLAVLDPPVEVAEGAKATGSPWRLPVVHVALTVMVTGQVVMVGLMSMTPVHIRGSGGDLTRVGLILSAHVFGMYGLAPVAGWIEDRFGSLTTIATALGTLATSAVLSAFAPAGGLLMGVGLLLLGIGWSFGFIAGSAMLARGIPAGVRTRVQGRVESVVWLTSASASLGAGLLLDVVGFVGLCLLALVVLVLPTAFVVRRRAELAAEPTTAA
jgi:MFS family permease